LAQKAVVLLEPEERMGEVVWPITFGDPVQDFEQEKAGRWLGVRHEGA
jgi:hypothetical protein